MRALSRFGPDVSRPILSRADDVMPSAGARRLLAARVIARLDAVELDLRLAGGELPVADRAMAIRAGRLTGRRQRHRIATAWQRLLQDARDPRPRFSAAITASRDEVLLAEPAILALVEYLRDDRPIASQAVAWARVLLTDGASAVSLPPEHGSLRSAVDAILDIVNSSPGP